MEGSLTTPPSIHASEYDPGWCMVALMRGLAESALKRRDSERKTRRGRLGECCAAMRKGGGGGEGGRRAEGRPTRVYRPPPFFSGGGPDLESALDSA